MRITGSHAIITGAASGLGAALAAGARERGASRIGLLDSDHVGLAKTADRLRGAGIQVEVVVADLTEPGSTTAALDTLLASGTPDLAIANAGAIGRSDLGTDDAEWERGWRLHVLSNVWLFRRLLPLMEQRGSGHLACTASAASLAPNPKSVVYTVTKHAQLALAEWVASSCRDSGVGFTCYCPGGMRTPMLERMAGDDPYSRRALAEADAPGEAAAEFLDAIESGPTLVVAKQRSVDALRIRGADHEEFLARTAAGFRSLPS